MPRFPDRAKWVVVSDLAIAARGQVEVEEVAAGE
jgi:hypothetical protein